MIKRAHLFYLHDRIKKFHLQGFVVVCIDNRGSLHRGAGWEAYLRGRFSNISQNCFASFIFTFPIESLEKVVHFQRKAWGG